MTWNYRIVKNETYHSFGIHEVYYENDHITGWTVEPVALVVDDDPGELESDLLMMLEACKKPVLEECGDKLIEWNQDQKDLKS